MNTRRNGLTLTLLGGLAFLCGCGNDGAGVKLAPVTGRVTFKNQAVTAIEIFLIPDTEKGTQGEMGSAIIGAEGGTFTISTNHTKGARDGVAPGSYLVTLGLGRRTEKELAKYRNVKTTPLKVEVLEEGLTDVVVDLDKGVIETK